MNSCDLVVDLKLTICQYFIDFCLYVLVFLHCVIRYQQEGIPVGCVPPACHISVATTKCKNGGGGVRAGPQVNKFEQVSSDQHQISLIGGGGSRSPGLMCVYVWRGYPTM